MLLPENEMIKITANALASKNVFLSKREMTFTHNR